MHCTGKPWHKECIVQRKFGTNNALYKEHLDTNNALYIEHVEINNTMYRECFLKYYHAQKKQSLEHYSLCL